MWEYAVARDMWVVDFVGCIVGMVNRRGQPIKKMWRVITTCETLALTLSQFVCCHPSGIHARIEYSTSACIVLGRNGSNNEIDEASYTPVQEGSPERVETQSETTDRAGRTPLAGYTSRASLWPRRHYVGFAS